MVTTPDSGTELANLREVARILLPGDGTSPAAPDVAGYDDLLGRALTALGPEAEVAAQGLALLPSELTWDSVREFSLAHPAEFEVVATVVSGAYFMSTQVLDSIGYPHGPRRAPRNDQVADELGEGLLDPVFERGSILREVP